MNPESNITKEEFLDAVKESRVFAVGTLKSSNGWTHFSFYVVRKNATIYPVVVKGSQYWNSRSRDYWCVGWGTNRVLECFLSIGTALDISFEEMKPQIGDILR